MLTEEEKKELEHLENREPRSDYDIFMDNFWYELRINFLDELWLPLHSAIYWTELKKEFNKFCIDAFNNFDLEIELEDDE